MKWRKQGEHDGHPVWIGSTNNEDQYQIAKCGTRRHLATMPKNGHAVFIGSYPTLEVAKRAAGIQTLIKQEG